jgi:broad specificity phosphatase PhoE
VKIQRPLVFVRHPESEGNVLSNDQRSELEIPNHQYSLTEIGVKQAEIAGQYLQNMQDGDFKTSRISKFFQSTFRRSQQGMQEILKQFHSDFGEDFDLTKIFLETDSRLDEKWDGIFHELSKKEIKEKHSEQLRLRKRAGFYHYRAPGGENCPDVEIRIRSFVSEHLSGNDLGYVFVVGHGRWFHIFQKLIHSLSVSEFHELIENSENHNCGITIYRPRVDYRGFQAIPKTLNPWEGKLPARKKSFA